MCVASIYQAGSSEKICDGHFGERNPANPFGVCSKGLGPRSSFSISARFSMSTEERNSALGAASGEKLTSAETPSAAPALRISGCSIEASYCAHQNHGTVQIGGKLTGASRMCRFLSDTAIPLWI